MMCSKSNGLASFLGHRPAYCLHGGKPGGEDTSHIFTPCSSHLCKAVSCPVALLPIKSAQEQQVAGVRACNYVKFQRIYRQY